jgi:hypothetical protein
MGSYLRAETKSPDSSGPNPTRTSLHSVILQRKWASGQHAGGGGCEECSKKKEGIQRHASSPPEPTRVPPIVYEVLRSPGQPLDESARAFFGPRFGHDFSQVRVHTDPRAAESARAMDALAYTVGDRIIFGAGVYAPGALEGRRILAHELMHTLQQTNTTASVISISGTPDELEAEQVGARVAAGGIVNFHGQSRVATIQRQGANPLDEKAKKIIEAAEDTSKGIDKRAIDAVKSIVKAYYDPTLLDEVVYDEKDPGLTTSPVGSGKDIRGQIAVGKYFVENIHYFARRVLQVGHEMQHIQQQRAGMGGPAKKNEREFLAFHWEATQPERAGTGKVPHATHVALIDEALRNYYCMPDGSKKAHASKKEELLKLRETEEKASGKEHKEAPTECGRKK